MSGRSSAGQDGNPAGHGREREGEGTEREEEGGGTGRERTVVRGKEGEGNE